MALGLAKTRKRPPPTAKWATKTWRVAMTAIQKPPPVAASCQTGYSMA